MDPEMTAMQSPRRMTSAASATEWVPVAQAETMHRLCPIAPVSMAIIPEVESGRALAMNVGATVRGPRSRRASTFSIISDWPPAPVPKIDPDLLAVRVADLEARVGQGLLGGRDAVVDRGLAAAGGLRVHPVGGHEVVDLAGVMLGVARRVEPGDLADPGDAR